MGRPLELTGYVMAGHLSLALLNARQERKHIINGLRARYTEPHEYIAIIGELLALIDETERSINAALEVVEANGYPTSLDPVEMLEQLLTSAKENK